MFTGIIKHQATLMEAKRQGSNMVFKLSSELANELHIDQSVSHDGVCLTVTEIDGNSYSVVAVQETLDKTTLRSWAIGQSINLELAMQAHQLLDGHMVQGHVDGVGACVAIENLGDNWVFNWRFPSEFSALIVSKGSIAINGISLTVMELIDHQFKTTIIPYTFEHTNLKNIKVGDKVNLEFDIIGKYIQKHLQAYLSKDKA